MARGNSLKTLDISSYISPQVVLTTAPQLLWARRRHCCISPSASPSDPHRHPATSRSPGKSRSRLLWNVGHGHYPKCSVWISVWPVANSAHRKSGSPLLRYSTSPFRTSPPPAPPLPWTPLRLRCRGRLGGALSVLCRRSAHTGSLAGAAPAEALGAGGARWADSQHCNGTKHL